MVAKPYGWLDGAILNDHSRRKHKILREYLFRYVAVRCQIPQQLKFRIAIIDGFAGAGRYACGSPGSPIIFIEELQRALNEINIQRDNQGVGLVSIECLLIFNDSLPRVIDMLQPNCAPALAAVKDSCPHLHLEVRYLCGDFQTLYPLIKEEIEKGRYNNVLYNLDQCGHSAVNCTTLADIMNSTRSVEIFYTLSIESLLAFLARTKPDLLDAQLRPFGLTRSQLSPLCGALSNKRWLGAAERIVFDTFGCCAPFVSPFSINNPEGWRYWLLHFANSYRARQVYNDVLHANSNEQAHFGRSGLCMLAYDPQRDGELYLFDDFGRSQAMAALQADIPRYVSEIGEMVKIKEFYRAVYNATAAHSDDIHEAMILSEDIEVVTPSGGLRRRANTLSPDDSLRLKKQKTFFPLFS